MAAKASKETSSQPQADAPISPADTVERKLGPNIGVSDSGSSSYIGSVNTYGPIKKGEVLWNIADEIRAGTSFGASQVMIAIFMQNPDAFLHNNINLMRVGKTLQLPSSEEISAISRPAAQKELRVQMDEWQAYKDGLASDRQTARVSYGDVTKDKPESIKKDADTRDVAGDKAMAEKPGRLEQGEDVLEIVRAKVDGADTSGPGASKTELARAKNEISAYQANIGLLEESLASSELEKKELSERVLLLEQQIDKANKLIDIQSTDLAQLQGKAATEKAADDYLKTVDKAAESESTKLSAPDISPIAPVAPEVKKPPVAKKPPAVEKKVVKARVQPKPVEQKGMVDSVMDFVTSSWITMLGSVLAIVLVLVGLFVVLRRRRSIAEFEDSIISGTAVLDISTADSTEPLDAGSETSFLSDFVPGMGNMQADEVDPLAEAEVYMAYGRDEQAEEVLKDATSKNPDRHELKLKLLEIYQGRKDVSSFETLAEELYPADGNIPMDVWAKVSEMGKIVNPENPLFQGDLNVKDETLFGDKGRKEDMQLGDLLDTGSVNTEEAELMDALNVDTEEVTEEAPAPGEVSGKSADDFPAPEEEVLDLDLGDFEPDEEHETDSFNLDSLAEEINELEGDTEESEDINEGEIDFNLEGIDLDLSESEESDTVDPALEDTQDMLDLEGLEDLNLDLGSALIVPQKCLLVRMRPGMKRVLNLILPGLI
jgi:pilus assembly protein FimV